MSAVGDDFYQEVMSGIGAGWSPNIAKLCQDWQRHEGGNADWNPWNTTQGAPGARDYNSVHVRIYPDRETGIHATVRTLRNGHYPAIVQAFVDDLPEAEWGRNEDILAQLGVWGTANWAAELRKHAGGGGGHPVDPQPTPHPHHDGMLRHGSHGVEVQTWQSELNQVDGAGLAEDGAFGPLTDHATRAFQSRHGLLADGIVGPKTQVAMAQALASAQNAGQEWAAQDQGGQDPYAQPGYDQFHDLAGGADPAAYGAGYPHEEAVGEQSW